MKLESEIIAAEISVKIMQGEQLNTKNTIRKIQYERQIHKTWNDIKRAKRWLKWSAQ